MFRFARTALGRSRRAKDADECKAAWMDSSMEANDCPVLHWRNETEEGQTNDPHDPNPY